MPLVLQSIFGLDKPHNGWRKAQHDSGIRNRTNFTTQMKWTYSTCKRNGWCLLPLIKPELHISELDQCDYKREALGFCSSIANVHIFWDHTHHTCEISFRCFQTEHQNVQEWLDISTFEDETISLSQSIWKQVASGTVTGYLLPVPEQKPQ
jgi:hypothetical protein